MSNQTEEQQESTRDVATKVESTTTKSFIKWSEIESFHHIRKYVRKYEQVCNGNNKVEYKCKVKLHGTNAAIQCHSSGKVVPQSRTSELNVLGKDNAGFAVWVMDREVNHWSKIKNDFVIFGEFCGPNIQKGVAISKIENKSFVVFAARSMKDESVLVVEPGELQKMVEGIPDTYVLPWYPYEAMIDWTLSPEFLQIVTDEISNHVVAVEACDPFVKTTFGIEGIGEGLVFFPISPEHLTAESFSNLSFKAKGKKHQDVHMDKVVQVKAPVAAGAIEFVSMVLTEPRLEQGATTVRENNPETSHLEYDKRLTGKFLAWIMADVFKECRDELETSSLTWSHVESLLTTRARQWYLDKNGIKI